MLSTLAQTWSLATEQHQASSDEVLPARGYFDDDEDFWRRGAHGVAPASQSLDQQAFLDMLVDVLY